MGVGLCRKGSFATFAFLAARRGKAWQGAVWPGRVGLGEVRYGKGANGAVHVEPEVFSFRNARERGQIINGADIDCACGSNHEEWRQTRFAVAYNRIVERVNVDPILVVRGNNMKRLDAKTGQIHGL